MHVIAEAEFAAVAAAFDHVLFFVVRSNRNEILPLADVAN
jgi:hypothetical protein